MRIATCLWATARTAEGETVRVRRDEKSYKACANVPVPFCNSIATTY